MTCCQACEPRAAMQVIPPHDQQELAALQTELETTKAELEHTKARLEAVMNSNNTHKQQTK